MVKRLHKKGSKYIFISTGIMTSKCINIANQLKKYDIGVIHCPSIQPLNFNEIKKRITNKTKGIFTFEDNYLAGGFGSLILEKIVRIIILRGNFFIKNFGVKKILYQNMDHLRIY